MFPLKWVKFSSFATFNLLGPIYVYLRRILIFTPKMYIFVQLKQLSTFVGVFDDGQNFLFTRRLVAILLLFYGIVTTLLYCVYEATTFQERGQCLLFLNSLTNGLVLYSISAWQQEVFIMLNSLQIQVNQRKFTRVAVVRVVFELTRIAVNRIQNGRNAGETWINRWEYRVTWTIGQRNSRKSCKIGPRNAGNHRKKTPKLVIIENHTNFRILWYIAGGGKVSNNLYQTTNANNENTSRKMIKLMFGIFLPLAAVPGMILSYYTYFMNGNDVASFKLMFYSA